jgi:hypothetical protein
MGNSWEDPCMKYMNQEDIGNKDVQWDNDIFSGDFNGD